MFVQSKPKRDHRQKTITTSIDIPCCFSEVMLDIVLRISGGGKLFNIAGLWLQIK